MVPIFQFVSIIVSIATVMNLGIVEHGNFSVLMISSTSRDSRDGREFAEFWVINLRTKNLKYASSVNLPDLHFQVLCPDGALAPRTPLGERVIETPDKVVGLSAGANISLPFGGVKHFSYDLGEFFELRPGTYRLRSYVKLISPRRQGDFDFSERSFEIK